MEPFRRWAIRIAIQVQQHQFMMEITQSLFMTGVAVVQF